MRACLCAYGERYTPGLSKRSSTEPDPSSSRRKVSHQPLPTDTYPHPAAPEPGLDADDRLGGKCCMHVCTDTEPLTTPLGIPMHGLDILIETIVINAYFMTHLATTKIISRSSSQACRTSSLVRAVRTRVLNDTCTSTQ